MPKPRNRRVWVHLGVAAATVAISVPAYVWWKGSLFFVIGISLATQIYTALSVAEASDDSAVTDRLDAMAADNRARFDRIEALLRGDR